MKKIPDPGKFSVSPLYKRVSVKLMHMGIFPAGSLMCYIGKYAVNDRREFFINENI